MKTVQIMTPILKPEICGALETTKHSVFKEKEAILDSATAVIFSGIAKNLDSRKEKTW